MSSQIHHIALCTDKIDWYIHFFQTVFIMSVCKSSGETPGRKIWFTGGIQLNEYNGCTFPGNLFDHISLEADDIQDCKGKALDMGCSSLSASDNWIQTPDGIKIELLQRR